MERLTVEDGGHYALRKLCSIDRYGGIDDRDSCAEHCEDVQSCENGNCAIQECFDRLGVYEDLEEQGKMPCAVGDKIIKKLEEIKNPLYREDGSLMGQKAFIRIDEAIEIVKQFTS